MILLQNQESQGLPAVTRLKERDKEGFSLRALRGNKPAHTLTLNFWPPEL